MRIVEADTTKSMMAASAASRDSTVSRRRRYRFTLGKFLIGFYFGNSDIASGFGAAGSLIVVITKIERTISNINIRIEMQKRVWAAMCFLSLTPERSAH